MGVAEMEDDRGMVMEDECGICVGSLVGRLVLMLIRAGILVCVTVVVVVGMVCFGNRSLSVKEVEYLGVGFRLVGGDIFSLDEDFEEVVVEVEVEDLELVVKALVRLVCGCLNSRIYFLWRLSLMSVERKISNVGGRLFSIVMWADFSRLLLFLNGGWLGRVTGAKVEVVIEMVVGLVAKGF